MWTGAERDQLVMDALRDHFEFAEMNLSVAELVFRQIQSFCPNFFIDHDYLFNS